MSNQQLDPDAPRGRPDLLDVRPLRESAGDASDPGAQEAAVVTPSSRSADAPHWVGPKTTIFRGDSLRILRDMPDESVDAVVTDPPYSSGGTFRSDRATQPASSKYVLHGTQTVRPEFYGDNRDQRSFLAWCSLWMAECLRIVRPGGVLMAFSDWRQYPTMSDAIQAGGWVWRGSVIWDKTEGSRPQKGWFRTGQSEFVMLGTKGSMPPEQERAGPCLAGVWRGASNPMEKLHITGKPVGLMRWLLGVVPAGGTVLDPFMGSGTTLVAARDLGLQSIGIEISEEYCTVATGRFSQDAIDFGNRAPSEDRPGAVPGERANEQEPEDSASAQTATT